MTTTLIKAILLSGALFPLSLTTAARCDIGLNEVSVTCVAVDGITEEQFPKKFGAAPRTDCNAIPTPATDPNFPNPHWRVSIYSIDISAVKQVLRIGIVCFRSQEATNPNILFFAI